MSDEIQQSGGKASPSLACSPELSLCQWCGAELSIQKQRTFRKTAKHLMLRKGKPMPAGPFCNVQCRSDYFGEMKDREFREMISANTLDEHPCHDLEDA